MLGITNLPAFIAAGILLNVSPGADTMYILGRSIAQGRKAGIYSALGIVSGVFVHITFAALGLSLIVARSAMVFSVIKYAGAVYLAYLGIQMLLKKSNQVFSMAEEDTKSLKKLYISGVLTNVLNPKVALFFLVFLPQFIIPSAAGNPLPFFILGIIFLIPGTIWCLLLALFSSMLATKIKGNISAASWINKITGGIFIALGLRLAFVSKK
ncbi:MAG: yrhP [Chitinophagaceae bacterium]|nr:yrhP [Chitinophagaceae bacterium]